MIFGIKILDYALFLLVTLIFIVLVLRACYYAFSIKQDPIKAVLPNVKDNGLYKWLVLRERIKQNQAVNESMS